MAKILVVDDEPMNRRVVRKVFGKQYEVTEADSGEEALALVMRERPDVILLDLHMPVMNGLDVLHQLSKMEEGKDIPVIFLTADDHVDTEVLIFKSGASDYIRKPLVAEVALQRVNRVVELAHMQDYLKSEVEKKTEELQISNRKIRMLSEQVMSALSGAIDAKDTYTNGHSSRVAEYAKELAVRMGYDEKDANDVYAAGLLHDVGKIGIPTAIINKPGRLTAEEFDLIKEHTTVGAEILERISALPLLSIGAHWHHERYDGTGYPDRLSGVNIPEIARIVCVADCYDAMTSNRSYRNMLPQDVVRGEIEKGLGSQFDPDIGRIMLQMMDEDIDYDMREH